MLVTSLNSLSELAEYLRKLSNKYEGELIFQEASEEFAEDLPIASEELSLQSSHRGIVKIKRSETISSNIFFKYFIDGVVETRPIKKIRVRGVEVPIHLAICGAGVFERTDEGEIRPTNNMIFLSFIAFPYSALKDLDKNIDQPSVINLNKFKPLIDKLQREIPGVLWLDTSISFGTGRRVIEKEDLLKTGYIRAKARDQASVIMRILEIGVLYLLKKSTYNGLIAFDGPISPLYIYAKLVSDEIQGLFELSDKDVSYNMLKDVIGCIKRVYKVPLDDTIYTIFEQKIDEQAFIIYPMSGVIKSLRDEDESSLEDAIRVTLSAFTVLRPELRWVHREKIVSNTSMITRFDIPLPNISERNEYWYQSDFIEEIFKEIFPNGFINLSSNRSKKLYEILKAITAERCPIPPAHGTKIYTELYPIHEAELWLKSYVKKLLVNTLPNLF